MGHLAGGRGLPVSVRPAANSRAGNPEDRRERLVEHPGDGATPVLGGPAGEIRPVVGDVEPKPDGARQAERDAPATGIGGGHVRTHSVRYLSASGS